MDLTEVLLSLLVEHQVLDKPLADALRQTHDLEGGSLDTAILETGLIDERSLQKYLEHASSTRNRVDPWSKPTSSAVSLLRPQQAATYRIIPFVRDGRTLEVLTNDPNDIRAIDEVGFITGCSVKVNVCTELRVSAHLFWSYHVPLPDRHRALLEGRRPMRPDIDRLITSMRTKKDQASGGPAARPKEKLGDRGDLQLDWPEGVTPIRDLPRAVAGPQLTHVAQPQGSTSHAAVGPAARARTAPPGPAANPAQKAQAGATIPTAVPIAGGAPHAHPQAQRTTVPMQELPDMAAELDLAQIGIDPGVPSPRQGTQPRAATQYGAPPAPAHPLTGRATMPAMHVPPVELPPLRPPEPPRAQIVGPAAPPPIVRARTATVPPPVAAPAPVPAPPPPLTFAQLKERLAGVKHRDEMTAPVMDHLSPWLARQVLFITKKKSIIGWDARGPRLSDAVQTISVGTDVPSLLEKVFREKVPYVGPLPDGDLEQYLMIRLGLDRLPEHIVVVPVVVKERTVALLYGESPSVEERDRARVPMTQVADLMAETLVRLILEKKKEDEPEPVAAAAAAPAPPAAAAAAATQPPPVAATSASAPAPSAATPVPTPSAATPVPAPPEPAAAPEPVKKPRAASEVDSGWD